MCLKEITLDYLLTVYCVTYNHREYIRDTLNGFLMQKTDFKFRIFIYDDASTDGTSDIIREYQEKYPSFICAYISHKNMYKSEKRWKVICALLKKYCIFEGGYIAFCEGDDYWVDSHKLQKQVDFLEKNNECSMTVHAEHVINYMNNTEYDIHIADCSRYLTPEEVITWRNGNVQMASFVYRSKDLIHDANFCNEELGDYARQLYELAKGKIFYFNDVMCVYRQGHQNSWTEKFVNDKWFALSCNLKLQCLLMQFDGYTNYQYHKFVRERLVQVLFDPIIFDVSVSITEYTNYIKEAISEKNAPFNEDRIRIAKIIRGEYKIPRKLRREMSARQNLIFGCGNYSSFLVKMLNNNGVDFDGYLVSDDQITPYSISNKRVWRLRDYLNGFENINVIIGVNQSLQSVINLNIKKYDLKFVYTPLWFDL